MNFTITLAWWHIPAVISVLAFLWALFWPTDDGGYFGDIGRLFMMILAIVLSLAAWAIAGGLK